ncbi:MAG TPA: HAMP domain-containing sensor histidine kinase [Permianibacter sp.]|nr:HAMP domain-containing sensor histidine kinase [Permianibacter sp.]
MPHSRFLDWLLPATPNRDGEARRRDQLQAAFLALAALLALAMFLHRLTEDGWQPATVATLLAAALILALLQALRQHADRRLIADASVLLVLFTILAVASQDNGLYSRVTIWLAAVPLIANFFPGRIRAALASLLIIVALFALAVLHQFDRFANFPELGSAWARFGAISAAMILISVTAWLYERNRREADAEKERLAQLHRRWVAVVSHELRTPLTALRGALVISQQAPQSPTNSAELLQMARRNCDRLIELVDDLLDMEHINSGTLKLQRADTDIAQLLASARVAHLLQAQDKVIAICTDCSVDVPVNLDAIRVEQILHQLLSNAIKFSPPHSEIQLKARRDGEWLQLLVCDQGPGISAELAARLFMPFSQGENDDSRRHGGLGLGLSIAQALVRAHGGRLRFDNLPISGCCFVVELPLHPSRATQDIR